MVSCCHRVGGAAMLRGVLAAVFCVALCLSVAVADEFRGKLKKVDTTANTVTVDVNGKDMTFKTEAATKFTAGRKEKTTPLKSGLTSKQLKEGVEVVVTTPEGKKGEATEVRVSGRGK